MQPRKRTIADARAELSSPQTRAEPEIGITGQRTAAAPANAAGTDTSQRAGVSDTNIQSSVIASRWPESSGVSPSASPAPAPDVPVGRHGPTGCSSDAGAGHCPGRAGRGGLVGGKTDRLDPDPADRRHRCAGAGGPDRKRDLQVRQHTPDRPGATLSGDRRAIWDLASPSADGLSEFGRTDTDGATFPARRRPVRRMIRTAGSPKCWRNCPGRR